MPQREAEAETHTLGFPTAVALVMGNMIGSGVFLLPASLAPYGGISLVGWVVSAGGAVLLALVFARLAAANPAAGGPYAYTRAAFGDLPGFLVAWGYWISAWSTNAALAVAFVGYLDPFVPGLVRNPASAAALAIGTVWLLTAVNLRGVRSAGRVQVATTMLKILPLLLVGVGGIFFLNRAHFAIAESSPAAFARGVTTTATLTLWAFLGLECATIPASSIRNAERVIPRATVIGTILAACIYIVSTVGVMGLVAPEALGHTTAPFADAARALAGGRAAAIIAIGAAISCFGALNGWILIVGQLPLAVARDGLFPRIFARVSPRGTPTTGLIVGSVLATALIGMNYTRGLVALFTFIILLATLSTLVPYVFCSLAGFLTPRLARQAARSGQAPAPLDSRVRPLARGRFPALLRSSPPWPSPTRYGQLAERALKSSTGASCCSSRVCPSMYGSSGRDGHCAIRNRRDRAPAPQASSRRVPRFRVDSGAVACAELYGSSGSRNRDRGVPIDSCRPWIPAGSRCTFCPPPTARASTRFMSGTRRSSANVERSSAAWARPLARESPRLRKQPFARWATRSLAPSLRQVASRAET